MLTKFKSAFFSAVGVGETNDFPQDGLQIIKSHLAPKFPYGRPEFLGLSIDQVQMSADHKLRPIIHPSKPLPHFTGYAECINAGKSTWNEDQAVYFEAELTKEISQTENGDTEKYSIPYTYYGIFDGHAGVGAALCAAKHLHHIIHQKLLDAQDDIRIDFNERRVPSAKSKDMLIVGALEAGFREMDQFISEDRNKYQAAGGCTALVALFLLGKVYIANAGDSRAVICQDNNTFLPMSMDFTPENERDRIRRLAKEQPDLLGNDFTSKEFIRQPRSSDLGKTVMFRDAYMKGWAYKTLEKDDLKLSVITGQGKRSRVMGTIGVTRGFGDHDLLAIYQKTPIKPFLSSHPEVQVHKITNTSEKDVLIMGTDGLWDVVDGSKAAEVVSKALNEFQPKEQKGYVSAATCLVAYARGSTVNEHSWQLKGGKPASCDDISVFVIPLLPYKLEYKKLCSKYLVNSESSSNSNQ